MGITLWTFGGLISPWQHLVGWLTRASMRALPRAAISRAGAPGRLNGQPARTFGTRPHSAQAPARPAARHRPVRVLRVVDDQTPAGAGRMVISGRMADVCAELDRLAALETSCAGRVQALAPIR